MGCKPSSLRAHPDRHPSPYPSHMRNTHPSPYTINPRSCSTEQTECARPTHHASIRSLRPSGSRLLHSLSTLSLSGAERADSLFEYDRRIDRPVRIVSVEELRLRGKRSIGDEERMVKVRLKKEGLKASLKENMKIGKENVGLPRRSTLPHLLVAKSGDDLRRQRESRIVEE